MYDKLITMEEVFRFASLALAGSCTGPSSGGPALGPQILATLRHPRNLKATLPWLPFQPMKKPRPRHVISFRGCSARLLSWSYLGGATPKQLCLLYFSTENSS
jgi:hypothetical protein